MDRVSEESRSRIMSCVRSHGNKTTEARLRAYLVSCGIKGWKLRSQGIIGKPDFVFPKERVAVFVDGAFWHGAPGFKRFPKSRTGYWKQKIERNKKRDIEVTNRLRSQGWSVLRFWDFDLKADPIAVIMIIKKKVGARKHVVSK